MTNTTPEMTELRDGSQSRALLERATVAVKKLQAENLRLRTALKEPIAIIGMACRFPGGASDPDAYWRVLAGGVDAIREIPSERWPAGALDLAELPALRWAGLLDAVDGFDAEFFGITPREAAQLDPQQRLLLEVSWEALENALQPADRLVQHPVGVFVGIASSDYQHRVLALPPDSLDGYSATGNMPSVAAGRLAYTLGLQGPCAAVDTACSSSLVALHLACQSLRSGESALALAGGVNLLLSPTWMRMVGLTQSLSPDGRCRTFDARANGFVRGEGCGMVVLKRLGDAQRDGDRIWAVIRGSAINHDGRSGGLTVPNVVSQQATLRKALDDAGVAPADIGYVEAHGTGTPIGDPIELEALKVVLGEPRGDGRPCVVGSVKTNLGHLEAAAGIAGLIKVVLALDQGTIPPHLHFRALNPRVALDGTALVVGDQARAWPAGELPRRAVVSSFGISGTNAGVIVEEAPARRAAPSQELVQRRELFLPLSARSPEALRALALAYVERIAEPGAVDPGDEPGDPALAQLAGAASTRRIHHPVRQAFVGASRAELIESLTAFARQPALPVAAARNAPRVAMIFPGQGSQWLGMGRELYAREPVFRDAVAAFDATVQAVAGWSVTGELFAEPARARLDQVDVIQPCIVAIQLGLAALWRSWGVEPAVVVGQSMGEVSAACVAGALGLDDAVRIITARSRLVKQLRGGAMASVELAAGELAGVLAGAIGDGLGIAAINGPTSTLVAGRSDAVDRLIAELGGRGVFCRKVKVDYASHSPEVEPLRAPLLEALALVRGRPAALAIRSTVHGGWLDGGDLGAAYWVRNLREPVQLFPVLEALLVEDGIDVLLEISPHPILGPVLQGAASHLGRDALVAGSLRRDQPEQRTLLHSLGALYARGQAIAFDRLGGAVDAAGVVRWSPLPNYPWQRRRHWLPASSGGVAPCAEHGADPGDALPPGRRLRSPALRDAVYEVVLCATSLRCFESHRVEGGAIAPATWVLSMVLAALRNLGSRGAVAICELTFMRPLALSDGEDRRVQLIVSLDDARRATRFQLAVAEPGSPPGPTTPGAAGAGEDAWTVVSEGAIASPIAAPDRLDLAALRVRTAAVPEPEVAAMIGAAAPGGSAGGSDRWIEELYRGDLEILCRVRAGRAGDHTDRFVLHPEPLNEALMALIACAGVPGHAPVAIGALELVSDAEVAWIHGTVARVESAGRPALSVQLALHDEACQPVAVLSRMHCIAASLGAETSLARDHYEVSWQSVASAAPAPVAPAGTWLVLADAGGICEALVDRLRADGHTCVCIARTSDMRSEEVGGEEVQATAIDPTGEDPRPAGRAVGVPTPRDTASPIAAAVSAARTATAPLRGTVFGWGLDAAAPPGPFSPGQVDAARGLLCLAGVLPACSLGPLWIATRGAVAVDDGDAVDAPGAAALWGMGAVLGREQPDAAPRLVDLDPAGSVVANAAQLHRALTAIDGGEDQLAARADRMLGLRLHRTRADRAHALALAADAGYLVTGGLGRLGLSVAEWLVARGARHVILVARSRPREAAARRIAALEAQGARIEVVFADVGDLAALREAIAAAGGPALRGVIHAAGQAHQALLADEPWRAFAQVLGAKAAGAWNLHELTRDQPLDFFVMFSSIAGILGFGGMGSYAAANRYLDALAAHRRARGLPALSVAWGLWAQELSPALAEHGARVGLVPFATAGGLAALEALIARGASQAVVASVDWSRHLQDRGGGVPPSLREVMTAPPLRAALADRTLLGSLSGLSDQDLADRLAAHVAGVASETLGYPRYHALPRQRGLFDLGFDSLLAMDLRRRLARDFGRSFPATLVFDHPTIERLAAHLASCLAGELRERPTAPRVERPEVRAVRSPAPAHAAADPRAGSPRAGVEPIAIVGIGCRFPGGAVDLDTFWQLLRDGRDATSEADRWSDAPAGASQVRRAGFLPDIASFDPELFGISPREATRMDPQQRLLLEVTWEALEHAGQPTGALVDSATGVFVSGAPNQYLERFTADPSELDAYAMTGNLPCTLSGRVSHVFGLRGPNVFIDTGCSGSLVALHLACQSLRAGECDLAIAGGVNVLLSADLMLGLGRTGALSPDGRCKTFDASANGFGRGEGCGVLVVKRLRDAEAAGDRVIAVVRGSAVNHDGRSGGLTVPSGPAQHLLMVRALDQAQVAASDVGFIEAHGTGTQLGDPIEVGALASVYGSGSGRTTPCFLGAVKSNLGHLEAAAGVAGVIKATLVLDRGEIPPNVHFSAPNPKLPLDGESFELPAQLQPWRAERRLAAVSSFGLGGTNAHVVLEAPARPAPVPAPTGDRRASLDRPVHVIAVSGHSREALVEQARRLSAHAGAHPEISAADLAFSANCGRTPLAHRLAVTFRSPEELRARLDGFVASPGGAGMAHGGVVQAGVAHGVVDEPRRLRIGLLYTGQGSQYAGMGRELYQTQPVFRDALRRCAAAFDGGDEPPLLAMLEPDDAPGEALDGAPQSSPGKAIDRTGRAQPALFALQYALTCLWRSWGIEPAAVFGHSVGEVAAACAAGVLDLDDAMRLIRERARWMDTIPDGGAMVSVRAAAGDVATALAPFAGVVEIAALNGPDHTVISGAHDAVMALAEAFRARGIEAKQLRVSVAFHSPAVEPILAPFARATAGIAVRPARIPWITGLTGTVLPRLPDDYWSRQIREPVQLVAAVGTLAELGCDVLLEIGPHPTLVGLAAEAMPGRFTCLPSLRRDHGDAAVIAASAARLHVAGAPIDWASWDRPFARRRHPLPPYAFQRRRLWFDAPRRRAVADRAADREHDRDADREASWYSRCTWREAPPPQPLPARPGDHWILLADAGGVALALAEQLARRGDTCTLAPGEVCERDIAQLYGAVPEGRRLRGIVHLSSLDIERDDPALDRALARNLSSPLAVVQALAGPRARGGNEPPQLWLVTRGAMCTGDEGGQVAVAQAPAWGLGAVIASEHPELWGGAIDLDPARDPGDRASADAAALAAEIARAHGEDRIALRGGRRLVARLVRHAPSRSVPLVIRGDATYLVTGGHGALGLTVAGWLAARGARHLALVSRRGPDEAAQATLAGLAAAGVVVDHVRADIGDPDAARAVVQRIADRGPALRGLVHAAGVVDDHLLVQQSWSAFERVLRPKLYGAWHLHHAAGELDFCVQFSSAASLLGPPGQANYAAANAFLDALAYRQRAQGIRAVTINWGPWQLGMAARLDAATARTATAGWDPLSAGDGWRALDRIVGGDDAQIAVLPVRHATPGERGAAPGALLALAGRRALFLQELFAGAPGDGTTAPAAPAELRVRDRLAASGPGDRERLLEDHVRRVIESTLGWSARTDEDAVLGARRRFVEVGMDSLMAVEIRNRLQGDLDVALAATTLFNYPTLAALTGHLAGKLAAAGLPCGPPQGPPVDASADGPAPAVEIPPAGHDAELSDAELIDLIAHKFDSRV